MNGLGTDVLALCLNMVDMKQQLLCQRVSSIWLNLIQKHWGLLWILDLQDPQIPLEVMKRVIFLSGHRLKILNIWSFNFANESKSFPMSKGITLPDLRVLLKNNIGPRLHLKQLNLYGHQSNDDLNSGYVELLEQISI